MTPRRPQQQHHHRGHGSQARGQVSPYVTPTPQLWFEPVLPVSARGAAGVEAKLDGPVGWQRSARRSRGPVGTFLRPFSNRDKEGDPADEARRRLLRHQPGSVPLVGP
jgi:hypothetical protein